ncbi:MAG: PEP-CTERM sorting domain-containing protein [Candidatus Acidiferrales bacterium]
MSKRLSILALVAVAALVLAAPAVRADGVQVTLTGVSGGSANGVETSPYYGTIGTQTGVAIVCDDYWHEVYVGESWMATENTFATLGQARFQGANAAATLLMYEEAAFLVEQLASNPGAANDISFAIWSIFSSGVPSTGNSAWWLTYAQNQIYTSGEFANFIILTPTDSSSGSAQEYLVNTPEPASMLLLGSGLFALGIWRRRTNRSAQVE